MHWWDKYSKTQVPTPWSQSQAQLIGTPHGSVNTGSNILIATPSATDRDTTRSTDVSTCQPWAIRTTSQNAQLGIRSSTAKPGLLLKAWHHSRETRPGLRLPRQVTPTSLIAGFIPTFTVRSWCPRTKTEVDLDGRFKQGIQNKGRDNKRPFQQFYKAHQMNNSYYFIS